MASKLFERPVEKISNTKTILDSVAKLSGGDVRSNCLNNKLNQTAMHNLIKRDSFLIKCVNSFSIAKERWEKNQYLLYFTNKFGGNKAFLINKQTKDIYIINIRVHESLFKGTLLDGILTYNYRNIEKKGSTDNGIYMTSHIQFNIDDTIQFCGKFTRNFPIESRQLYSRQITEMYTNDPIFNFCHLSITNYSTLKQLIDNLNIINTNLILILSPSIYVRGRILLSPGNDKKIHLDTKQ